MNANELREAMAKLPEPKTDLKPPYWEYWRWDLWQQIVSGGNPENFMLWPCIYHTMLVDHWPDAIDYEYSQVGKEGRYNRVVDLVLPSIDHYGPAGIYSANLIHQAYHIYQWEKATNKKVNELNSIVEFGGGYGAMALVCRRLGFTGKYYIYDLPEFALLQQWFLSQCGVDGIIWNSKKIPKDIDLYMALYSMSEVKPEDRFIPPHAKSYLFLYSGQWESYDNVKYFQYFQVSISELVRNWVYQELTHLPDRNNWYSIGWRNMIEILKKPPERAVYKGKKLFNGASVTYYAEYSDGCSYAEYSDGSTSWNGEKHTPHLAFYPDDIPIKIYGLDNYRGLWGNGPEMSLE